ncbi:MAG: RDD family protein [Lewinellaceae bacterium]|nr:RDD family protein [Lewinellaceae bacterium]
MEILDQANTTRYASFTERAIASLIDGIVIGMLSAVFFIFSFGLIGTVIISFLYFALLESGSKQATFGKRVMNIYVTDMAGNRISFWQGIGRNLLRYVSFGIFFVGLFMMFFTQKRQCLHDLVTGSLVLKR